MKRILFLISLLAPMAAPAQQPPATAGNYLSSRMVTNYFVPVNSADKVARVFSVTAYSDTNSSSQIYLHLFDTNALPANGTVPVFVVPLPGDKTGGFTFDEGTCPFTNGLCIAASSTPVSLTNSGGVLITVIFNTRVK